MAVGEIPLPVGGTTYPEIGVTNLSLGNGVGMRGVKEIVGERESPRTASSAAFKQIDRTMFVALGKDMKESEPVLTWALQNSKGMNVCILHVHQPAKKIPMMGTRISISMMEEHQVKAYHENERQEMHKILDKYIQICDQTGVRAEKLWKESVSIEKGLVELISELGIKWLVMGAAANRSYSRKMKEPKSKKANHVRTEAPSFCYIWFVCKGNLVYTREGELGDNYIGSPHPGGAPFCRSRSVAEGEMDWMKSCSSIMDYRRVRSENHGVHLLAQSNGSGGSCHQNCLNPDGTFGLDSLSGGSPAASNFSTLSSEIVEHSASIASSTGGNETGSELIAYQLNHGDHSHSSGASSVPEGNMINKLYEKLEQYVAEAESSGKEAYDESVKSQKAEKDVIDAILRAKASETMHALERQRRSEIEEELARSREEAEKMKSQLNEVIYNLKIAQKQRFMLECQIADSDRMVEELEQKMYSAVDLLKKYKKERDDLQAERDNALREAEELRIKQTEAASSSSMCQFFSEFCFFEIEEATNNFRQSMKIGEGGYGCIYRGILRHTQVAIKMPHPNSAHGQGPAEFQQEVNILSKLRHPNIVTLIGACPEALALIYEYLPNGSLEDRLNCKNNTPPLSWKTRIRIAAELCSALIFLHSCHDQGIVHGDLKPANVLLDANFVSKLSDFGICRRLPKAECSENNTTVFWRTDPKGTLVYMDPEFLATGELTSMSDVYAFGIILLRLLTGKPALGLTKEVKLAIDKGNLKDLLDPTAGDWPFVQAKQLAHLALSCCDVNRSSRPDLVSEVCRVLEPMKVSCGVSSLRIGTEERYQVPPYFVCPIFQEIMREPIVAADGFTYETEAIKGWLESGHDTSPMTNLKLLHCDLLPNHALRSAIQEWLHTP